MELRSCFQIAFPDPHSVVVGLCVPSDLESVTIKAQVDVFTPHHVVHAASMAEGEGGASAKRRRIRVDDVNLDDVALSRESEDRTVCKRCGTNCRMFVPSWLLCKQRRLTL